MEKQRKFRVDAASSTINLENFKAYIREYKLSFTDEQAEIMFKFVDHSGKGEINIDEVAYVLKLALKGSKKEAFIRILIPSNKTAQPNSVIQQQDSIRDFFTKTFGGCTLQSKEEGSFLLFDGSISRDETTILKTYTTLKRWKGKKTEVKKFLATVLLPGQDCIGLEVNGTTEYVVSAEAAAGKDAGQLLRQLVLRVQLQDEEAARRQARKVKKQGKKEKSSKGKKEIKTQK